LTAGFEPGMVISVSRSYIGARAGRRRVKLIDQSDHETRASGGPIR